MVVPVVQGSLNATREVQLGHTAATAACPKWQTLMGLGRKSDGSTDTGLYQQHRPHVEPVVAYHEISCRTEPKALTGLAARSHAD